MLRRVSLLRWCSVVAVHLLAACAAPPTEQPALGESALGPTLEIPAFAADDPRVGTAGFVGKTLRVHQEEGGVRYTLMAFVVGDTLTLGAMTKGAFAGTVAWQVGAHRVVMPFDSTSPAATTTAVVDDGRGAPLATQGASFQGTAWINLDVPQATWLPDGTPLALAFVPRAGSAHTLPGAGAPYRARAVPAP